MTTEIQSTHNAAVLLLALGENEAATVLKHLDAKTVQRLGSAMAQIKSASRDEVTSVVGDFVMTLDGQADIKVGTDDYIRKVLTDALGEDKAGSIIDRILVSRKSKGLDVLKWMDPRTIADIIRQEHPQVLAIITSYLDADLAAKVLAEMPEWLQAEVLLRVSQLDGVQPTALGKLDEMIEKQIASKGTSVSARLGGTKTIPIDVRLVAATNRNLTQMMGDKLFRSDLYYRLKVFPITTPPLRDRPEDIPVLVRHFTKKYAAKMGRQIDKIPSETMRALVDWRWPGNIRELENFIERSVILSKGPSLRAPLSEIRQDAPEVTTGDTLEQVERDHIVRVLQETDGVVSKAAARLGIPRTTLNALMRKLDISRKDV